MEHYNIQKRLHYKFYKFYDWLSTWCPPDVSPLLWLHGNCSWNYKQVKVHRLCKVADLCLEFKLTRPSYSEANVKHVCKYKAWIQVLDTSMTQRQICKIQSMRIWSYNIEKISEIYCYNHKMYISSFFFSHWLSWLSNYTK